MKGNSVAALRSLLRRGFALQTQQPTATPIASGWKLKPSSPSVKFQRIFCSAPGSSSISLIKSEEDFNNALKSVQEKSLPAILYFTAVWCGPCRFVSPIIEELNQKYPHVTTYKIDIDQEGLERTLQNLSITAVPTLHFFKDGKKAAAIVGADVAQLKQTAEKLYG